MADRIITAGISEFGSLGVVYQVSTPVGNGSDNKRIADVQLVQLFLRHFFILKPDLFRKLPQGKKRTSEIQLDGKVGSQTIAGITEFQKHVIRQGKSGTIVDGRVSVPNGFRVQGSSHVFTMHQLNVFFFNTDPINKSFNDDLAKHPLVKVNCPLLAAEISRPSPAS